MENNQKHKNDLTQSISIDIDEVRFKEIQLYNVKKMKI